MPHYYWPLWRSVIGRDTFSPLAQALGPSTKFWLSHPLPLSMGVSTIPWCHLCDTRVDIALGIRVWQNLGFYAWTSSYVYTLVRLNQVVCGMCRRWFERIAQKLLVAQRPRHFGEIGPEILHTCPMNPCQPVTECFFFFASDVFFVFLRRLGLGDPKFPEKKKKEKHSSTAWQGLIEHMGKREGSMFQKRAWHLDFCAQNMCHLR